MNYPVYDYILIKFILSIQDSRLVVELYKSGFAHPVDLPFEDLSCPNHGDNNSHAPAPRSQSSTDFKNQNKPGTTAGRTKKRGGLFSLFGSSKVSHPKIVEVDFYDDSNHPTPLLSLENPPTFFNSWFVAYFRTGFI